MQIRPVHSVTLIFADGTVDTFTLQEGAGYYRESYTYEATDKEGLSKWGGRIETHEIFWTERKEGKQ